jgi:tRNA 2-thiouridine synthesizing protein A
MFQLKQIDARGVSCPQPVIMTKKALEQNQGDVEILVDNSTARNNVERFVKSASLKSEIKELDGDYSIVVRR